MVRREDRGKFGREKFSVPNFSPAPLYLQVDFWLLLALFLRNMDGSENLQEDDF
jgi:hypothetical protein